MTETNIQVIRGLHNCQTKHQNMVITIGNFDGLHIGHKKMLEQLNSEASRLNTQRCLITFEPLPREFFARGKPTAARLTNRGEKIRTLNSFAPEIRPDYLLFLHFDQALASMSASQFIEDILIEKLSIKSVIVGDDFRFGCDRQGDFTLLKAYGEKHHFSVINIASHCIDEQRVSST